jgi:biotin carboxylase
LPRVLIVAATTGYQTRAFGEAAERLGIDLVFATDRCHRLDDPWRDEAVPIRFSDPGGAAETIVAAASARPIDGILAVGDRPTIAAAIAAEHLGLPGHPPAAARIACNKRLFRERLREAGLPVPRFTCAPVAADARGIASSIPFPAVVKPLALSGSRGVMRVDDGRGLAAAFERLRTLLQAPDIRRERDEAHDYALVEEFVQGPEFAVEAVVSHGVLRVLAIFDKPDPLDGPFFEETIYATPSQAPAAVQRRITAAISRAAQALGLRHGPLHAECRVNEKGVFVIEAAARPIGGLCARALRFALRTGGERLIPFEELLLRHALGESAENWQREPSASGVMMIPIPRRGMFRGVSGLDAARRVEHVEDVRITAKADQLLVPLPEGASYLGFIFARAATAGQVDAALRAAHRRLRFAIDPQLRVVQSTNG